MSAEHVHPVTHGISAETVQRDFLQVAFDKIADPLWHFEMVVPRTSQVAPAVAAAPKPGGELTSLALLHQPEPPCDIEIFGQHLLYEIDPADWLDGWIEHQGFAVLSRKRVNTVAGAVGDVLVRWEIEGAPFIGRLFCCKAGHRLVLVWFRTAEAHYAALAEPMFLSLANFRLVNDSPGAFAERVQWMKRKTPVPWRVALPESWKIEKDIHVGGISAFQGALIERTPGAVPQTLGKMSMAVVAPDLVPHPHAIFEKMFAALRDGGVEVQPAPFLAAPVAAPYLNAWQSDCTGTVNGRPAEVRCRVFRHPKAWAAALVVHPPRTASPWLWMRGRRLLDITTDTLEIS